MSCRPNIFVGYRAFGACIVVVMALAVLVSTPVNAAPIACGFLKA